MSFLLSRDVRNSVFGSHAAQEKAKPHFLFFAGQAMGGLAFMLQSFSVSLAPQASVPAINAMAGIQYVAIFVFSIVISHYFPHILKEKAAPGTIVQRLVAIALIMFGLAIFALN
jgi:hypothetical protein